MVRRRSGHIVAISSVQGRIAIPHRSACKLFLLINPIVSICLARTVYRLCSFRLDAASKHATQAYFDCLRAELEHCGIRVSVISPGYIRTNLSINAITGDGSQYGGQTQLRSIGYFCKQIEFQMYINITSHFSSCVVSFGQEYGARS